MKTILYTTIGSHTFKKTPRAIKNSQGPQYNLKDLMYRLVIQKC